jgi:hypothetical protein
MLKIHKLNFETTNVPWTIGLRLPGVLATQGSQVGKLRHGAALPPSDQPSPDGASLSRSPPRVSGWPPSRCRQPLGPVVTLSIHGSLREAPAKHPGPRVPLPRTTAPERKRLQLPLATTLRRPMASQIIIAERHGSRSFRVFPMCTALRGPMMSQVIIAGRVGSCSFGSGPACRTDYWEQRGS